MHSEQNPGGGPRQQSGAEEEAIARQRQVGVIARILLVQGQVVTTPGAGGEPGDGMSPAPHQPGGVLFVAEFAVGRGADVVPHHAVPRDVVDQPLLPGAEAEVDVLAAIDEGLVEAAELLPGLAAQGEARSG